MNKKKKKQTMIATVAILILVSGVFAVANLTVFSLFGEENTVIYYFNAYDEGGEEWAVDPDEMCDGDTGRWAVTNQPGHFPPDELQIQYLTANTCDGADLGTITKIEIRAKVDGPYSPPDINYVTLRPIFSNGDGSNFQTTVIHTMWGEWFDITTDINAPSPWTWDDIVNLKCDVEGDVGLSFIKCAIVEIRVTFQTETPPPPTYNIAITILNSETYHGVSSAEVTINDEMKHADGMGKVEFNLLEGTYTITIDRYDLEKSIELLTIPYHCPTITFYLDPIGNADGDGNGEVPPEDENGNGEVPPEDGEPAPESALGTPGFEFMVLIVAIGVAFIYIKKRRRL